MDFKTHGGTLNSPSCLVIVAAAVLTYRARKKQTDAQTDRQTNRQR